MDCCNETTPTEPERGTIELSLESPDRGIFIVCPEDITLWQLGARFREFAHALGFAPSAIDDLIDPKVDVWMVEGYPNTVPKDYTTEAEGRPCCGAFIPCSPQWCAGSAERAYDARQNGQKDNTQDYRYNN